MGAIEIVLGIIVIVLSVVLSITVLAQSGKDKKMGAITGGSSDTFYGKQKGKRFDALLSKATIALAAVFTVLVIVMYIVL